MHLGRVTGREAVKELCLFYKGRAVNLVEFSSHVKFTNNWYNCLNITSLLLTIYVKWFLFCPFGDCFHWLSQGVVEIQVSWSGPVVGSMEQIVCM